MAAVAAERIAAAVVHVHVVRLAAVIATAVLHVHVVQAEEAREEQVVVQVEAEARMASHPKKCCRRKRSS